MKWLNYFILITIVSAKRIKPNFVLILTDDQDTLLGGLTPLKKTKSLIAENGIEFTNMFVATPLCCPSRASILTGKYAHNHGVVNNSINGNCNSKLWQEQEEPNTFITYLQKDGYSTFYSGKYLNQYGKNSTGGLKHVPPGWKNWIALVGNSCYYDYTLSRNGNFEYHGSNYQKDYLSDLIFREAVGFLQDHNSSEPFFMFLSPPAPHAPFESAPQYQRNFSKLSAPRTPNFDVYGGKHKHWLLRQPPSPLPDSVVDKIDQVFRKRWQTLLSVDDGIQTIVQILKDKKILHQTYIFFTSDNGFHLGQFSLPWDKRQLYEFDVRVPLFVRGPNIKPGRKIQDPVLNIDLAPTILNLAGLPVPSQTDGLSFASHLTNNGKNVRSHFIIEHKGEASDRKIPGCPQYRSGEMHTCEIDCICEDSWNNTYICIRELSHSENSIACFLYYEKFIELYNLTEDPFQMNNLFPAHENLNFASYSKLMKIIN